MNRLEDMEITVSLLVDGERHKATFVYDFDESLEEMTQRIEEYIRLRTWHFDNEPRDRDAARLYDALTEANLLREQNDQLRSVVNSRCGCDACARQRAVAGV